jgi:hypothetical protein
MTQPIPHVRRLFLWGVVAAQKQKDLIEVAHTLDFIRLSQHLEQLLQALFRWAVRGSPFVPNPPRAPLCVFAVDDCKAGLLQALGSAPDPAGVLLTLNQGQVGRKRALSWRRTHKDPSEGEWEQILSWLAANPER